MASIQNLPDESLPFLYVYGFVPTITFSGSNTSVTFTPGQCRDSNNKVDINIPNSLTVNLAVNGLLGLDRGPIAESTMYAFYALADSSGRNQPSMIASGANNATPYMPDGYDSYRLITFWATGIDIMRYGYTTGNSNTRIFQYQDFNTFPALSSGNATSLTDVNLTAYVPPYVSTRVELYESFSANATGDFYNLQSDLSTTNLRQQIAPYAHTTGLWNRTDSINTGFNGATPVIAYQVGASTDQLTLFVTGFTYFI